MIADELGFDIDVNIGSDQTEIQLTEKGKKLPPKVVGTDKFLRALTSIKTTDDSDETPLLPGDYGTRKMLTKSGGNYYFLITTPPRVKSITYSEVDYEEFRVIDSFDDLVTPGCNQEFEEALDDFFEEAEFDEYKPFEFMLPSFVWMIHLRQKNDGSGFMHVRSELYAKDSMILSMDDTIYKQPLANIYADNNVCWGSVDIPSLTVQGAMAVDRIFLSNDFNTDLEVVDRVGIDIDGYTFYGKLLHLLENKMVLEESGREEALEHINTVTRQGSIFRLGGVWDDFTRR